MALEQGPATFAEEPFSASAPERLAAALMIPVLAILSVVVDMKFADDVPATIGGRE